MNKFVTVTYRGRELLAFKTATVVLVALKPIVEGMGLDWEAQRQRVRRDPVLSKGTSIIKVPFGPGGPQSMLFLRLDLVNGWLFTIDSTRIRNADLRRTVQVYQEECYKVLYEHFSGKRLSRQQQKNEVESFQLRMITELRQIAGPLAAFQLWKQFGFPTVPALEDMERQLELFPTKAA